MAQFVSMRLRVQGDLKMVKRDAWSLWLGKDKGTIMKSAESCSTIHLKINFSSRVYSKSLLKVGLLKGSPRLVPNI